MKRHCEISDTLLWNQPPNALQLFLQMNLRTITKVSFMWFSGTLSRTYKYSIDYNSQWKSIGECCSRMLSQHLRGAYAAPCHRCHVEVITFNISHSFYKNCTAARKVKLSLITKTAVMDSKHEAKRGLISERKSRHPATYIIANKNNISSLILARSLQSPSSPRGDITHTLFAVINSWPVPLAAVLACGTSG